MANAVPIYLVHEVVRPVRVREARGIDCASLRQLAGNRGIGRRVGTKYRLRGSSADAVLIRLLRVKGTVIQHIRRADQAHIRSPDTVASAIGPSTKRREQIVGENGPRAANCWGMRCWHILAVAGGREGVEVP